MFIPLFLFAVGTMGAIAICNLWGKLGGDEKFEKGHPKSRTLLHALHHWMFGLATVCLCPLFTLLVPVYPVFFFLGLGVGLFIDDVMFHSYECYFQRKCTD